MSPFPAFETGLVAVPDGERHRHYNVPSSVLPLPCGQLLCVFNAHTERGKRVLGTRSADGGRTWEAPEELFGNEVPAQDGPLQEKHFSDGVIVVTRTEVHLYAVSPRVLRGPQGSSATASWRRVSRDGGLTFGPITPVPRSKKYFVGTVQHGLRLQDGSLAMGYSWDVPSESGAVPQSEGEMVPRSGALLSRDEGVTWETSSDVTVDAPRGNPHLPRAITGVAEPALVELSDGRLFLLARTGTNRLWQSYSADGGRTWEAATASPLISHNCPAALMRLDEDGTVLVAFNNHELQRSRLSVALSKDNCQTWSAPRPLTSPELFEEPTTSYPSLCRLPDGKILAVYAQRSEAEPDAKFVIRWTRFERGYVDGVPQNS